VLIIAVGVWAYHNSFQGPFIFDDVPSILDNPHIRHLWPIWDAMSRHTESAVSGRPVVCLTLTLNYAFDGLNVRGYHAFNLAVHLLAALVLFGVLRRTFEGEKLRDRFGASAVWLAAAIALIWEVHPLQTECVTYIVQRTESLMGLFLLLTLYCTLRGSQSSRPRVWYLAAVVSCALGMGSKEVMVGAPLIVLLYDRVFLAASFRQLWQRRGGLYVGMAATWVMLGALVAGVSRSRTGFGIEGLTSWDYLKTEAGVIVYYLRLCFWPRPLVIDYFDWPIALSLKDALVAGVVVIGLLGATVWAFRRQPWLGFLGAWFFVILGPTSSFLPSANEAAAERRMYLPLAAVVTLTVVGAVALGKRLFSKQQGVVLGCAAGGSLVVLFTFLTIQRNQDYRSDLAIWRDTAEKRPSNARAHNNLGFALAEAGRLDDAIGQCEEALRLRPDYAEARVNLGVALEKLGRPEDAIRQYEEALRIEPDFAMANKNLAGALMRVGKTEGAIRSYKQLLQIAPDSAETHRDLGLALEQAGRTADAIEQYQQAARLNPDDDGVFNDWGIALEHWAGTKSGVEADALFKQAAEKYGQALRVKPDCTEALNNWGTALWEQAKTKRGAEAEALFKQALEKYEQALRIKPDYAGAHYNLALALLAMGNSEEAARHLESVLQFKPDSAEVHHRLAEALARTGRVPEAIAHYDQALRIKPDFAEAYNNLAWLLGTHTPAEGGDAVRAVDVAQRACELTGNRRAGYLDTLAAAYAAAGQFREAVATAQKAIDLARAAGQPKLVGEYEARLELYRSGHAYFQSVGNVESKQPLTSPSSR